MNYLLRILSRSTVAALCLLLVASPTLVACDDDDDEEATEQEEPDDQDDEEEEDDDDVQKGEEARTPTTAPTELAAAFPADAEGIITVASVGSLVKLPEDLMDSDAIDDGTRAQWEEMYVGFRKEMKAEADVDLFDPATLDEWGIDPDGELYAGFIPEPVVCVGIQDDWDFHAFAQDVYAEGGDDVDIEQADVDGHEIYLVDDEAWVRHGDSACASFEDNGAAPEDTLAKFLEGPGEGNSIADSEEFQQFTDSGLADGLISFYTEGDEVMDELLALAGPGVGMVLGDLFGGQGGAVTVEDDVFQLRGWSGLDASTAELAQGIVTPDHSFEWSRFATQDTTAALRLSLNPERIWEQASAFLEDEFDAMTDELFGDAAVDDAEIDVDAEDTVINNLSGHIGVFVYDLPDPMDLMLTEPADLGAGMEVLIAVHFSDAERLAELFDDVETLMKADPDSEYRSLDDDLDVIAIDDFAVQLYYHDDIVAVATTGIDEDEVASLIRGERADESLASTGSPLGAALEEDAFNGLYLGGDIWSYIGDFAEMPGLDKHFDEFLLRVDADDHGFSIGTDVYPAGSAIYGLAYIGMLADTPGPGAQEVVLEEVAEPPAP